MSKSLSAIMGFIAGAAAGTAIGILFAPDAGTTTRKKIKEQTQKVSEDLKNSVAHRIDDLSKYVSGFIDETKEKIAELEKTTKAEIKSVKDKVAK
jgi:gas vesicle protein